MGAVWMNSAFSHVCEDSLHPMVAITYGLACLL